jgi:hypothetical protein
VVVQGEEVRSGPLDLCSTRSLLVVDGVVLLLLMLLSLVVVVSMLVLALVCGGSGVVGCGNSAHMLRELSICIRRLVQAWQYSHFRVPPSLPCCDRQAPHSLHQVRLSCH